MDEELRQKIVREIDKSGIPLELEVVNSLRAGAGWSVRQGVRYEADGKVREVDALASLGSDDIDDWGHPNDRFLIDLVIECKKSKSNPWVFFEEPSDPLSELGLVPSVSWHTDLRFSPDCGLLDGCRISPLSRHHYGGQIPTARSYFEAFRRDGGQDIYKALLNVERGKVHLTDSMLSNIWKNGGEPPWHTRLIHGVIVLDGVLALAKTDHGRFEVNDVQHLLLRSDNLPFSMDSPGMLNQHEVVIDVVHVDGLKSYLALVGHDLEALASHMTVLRESGAIRAPFI